MEKNYIRIIITQLICCVIILLSVLGLKYFFKKDYKAFKAWYEAEASDNTYIEEVLE